ncbi:outer membrane beta-barrel protein [Flavisolibacter tropicus]|uniref:Outer membrane protein beta-barrel domain-containing protein n=1 Tax=Flavisolibacter tropicus TaxID=1492898 RepID=A0A172U0A8_9BACT|nr:outer membrane beta-barrel protein [Flavisolibacter tropicus]ANE52750.1 hypothetical protein SY85_22010 [Flavisolibacter tropicus]
MQEQNFEKQVQHKLEELSLTPSVPVWQKVEKEIREKKKRRRAIVFWLFPLLLGTGMFWGIKLLTTINDHQVSKIVTPNTQIENKQSLNPSNKESATNTEKQPITAISINPKAPTETTKSLSSDEAAQNSSSATVKTNVRPPATPDKSILISQEKTDHTKPIGKLSNKSAIIARAKKQVSPTQPLKQKNTTTVVPGEAILLPAISEPTQDVTTGYITEITADPASNSITKTQPLDQLISIKEGELKPTIISDSIQNKKGQEKVRKWSWTAQASYGIASLQTDFLSKAFGTPLAMSDPLSNAGFPSTTPTPAAFQPSRMENGAALHVGIAVKRNIDKRFSTTAGFQYSYLTLKNSVGQTVVRDTMIFRSASVDMVLSQFYRPVQTNSQLQEYVNKYHFLELPLGIEWKVNRRLPLHLQTGLSLAYLFKTNALVYDPNARIYYQNNDLFSKMQLQFFSGVTYNVWQHKNLSIQVGPYLQFGLTSLEKENKNHHLLSTGLKTAFSF